MTFQRGDRVCWTLAECDSWVRPGPNARFERAPREIDRGTVERVWSGGVKVSVRWDRARWHLSRRIDVARLVLLRRPVRLPAAERDYPGAC